MQFVIKLARNDLEAVIQVNIVVDPDEEQAASEVDSCCVLGSNNIPHVWMVKILSIDLFLLQLSSQMKHGESKICSVVQVRENFKVTTNHVLAIVCTNELLCHDANHLRTLSKSNWHCIFVVAFTSNFRSMMSSLKYHISSGMSGKMKEVRYVAREDKVPILGRSMSREHSICL